MVLEIAKIIREDFLQQNAFSEYDFNCPLPKSVGMLRCIVTLYARCLKAVTGGDGMGKTAAVVEGVRTVTWNYIKATAGPAIQRVTDMKFLDPRTPEPEMVRFFAGVQDAITEAFDTIAE